MASFRQNSEITCGGQGQASGYTQASCSGLGRGASIDETRQVKPSSAISSAKSRSISRRANASVLRVSASCRSESGPLAWGAILQPEKQSRSRPAKRSLSGRPRI